MQALVTIVTVCKNCESTIADTVQSVLKQSWANIEYVIVDGASTDKTVERIQELLPLLQSKGIQIKLISEPDSGIADGWNKGIRLATGEVICLLNGDDWLAPDAVENAMASFTSDQPTISYGVCVRVDSDKRCIRVIHRSFSRRRLFFSMGFSFTSCFVNKRVYQTIGLFDEGFKIALDVDFLLRAVKSGLQFVKGCQVVYMRDGGVSNMYLDRSRKEYRKALLKNGYDKRKVFFAEGLIKLRSMLMRLIP